MFLIHIIFIPRFLQYLLIIITIPRQVTTRILFILGNSSIEYVPNITYLLYIRITEALVAANEHFLIKGKDGYVPILLMIITLIIIV